MCTLRQAMARHRLVTLLVAALIPAAPLAAEGAIEVWARQPGDYALDAPGRGAVARVELARLELRPFASRDVQYDGAERRYRGVALNVLMEGLAPPRQADLALLHFANDMVVPVPTNPTALKALDLWIAVEIWSADRKGWSPTFPPVARSEQDHRPIRFGGNKVVASSARHPMMGAETAKVFTPWRHVDSLTGIEFVSRAGWYRQFDAGAGHAAGLEVYKGSCQFCHGVRQVGASLGWDFVEPLPVVDVRRSPKALLFHVRYRETGAARQGLLMPAIPSMTEAEAKAVHGWMKAIANTPLRPYRP